MFVPSLITEIDMKKLTALVALALTVTSAEAATIFLKREYVNGQIRQCVYDYYGNDYIVSIPAHQLCRLSITV